MIIGSHVSNSGNDMLLAAAKEAVGYQANTFMVYMGAPQNTVRKKIDQFKIDEMKQYLQEQNIDIANIVVHAPYILNFAQPNPEKRQFAVDFLVQEIEYVHQAGFSQIVIHPGAHVKEGVDVGLQYIAESLAEVLQRTQHTKVTIALETMAGKGTECAARFEEIQYLLKTLNHERLGVCLDTCHIHDAGYDIVQDYEGVIASFDNIIGLDKITVLHINDSKNTCGARKDRHENIGFGNIGFDTLSKFVWDERFSHIPKILETPYVKDETKGKSYAPYQYEIAMFLQNRFDTSLKEKILSGLE